MSISSCSINVPCPCHVVHGFIWIAVIISICILYAFVLALWYTDLVNAQLIIFFRKPYRSESQNYFKLVNLFKFSWVRKHIWLKFNVKKMFMISSLGSMKKQSYTSVSSDPTELHAHETFINLNLISGRILRNTKMSVYLYHGLFL